METMDDTEDQNGYEKEGNKYFEEEDGNFDVSNFIDPEEGEGKEKDGFPDERATVSRKGEEDEIDPDELEETVNKLEEVFSCLPRVLIQRILCRDDVKGNIEIASQRLQEFQNMDDPQDMFKSPMTSKSPAAQQHPVNDGDLVGKSEPQSFDEGKKKKRNRRKSKKNVNDNGSQMEQMEVEEQLQWRRNSLDRNQTDQRDGNQVYCGQESRRGGGFRGQPRGGKKGGTRGGLRGGPRGGFGQGQRCHQEYRDVFHDNWRFDDGNFMPQPQRGRRNVNDPGHAPNIRPIPRGRPQRVARGGPSAGPRGGFVHDQGEYQYGQYQKVGKNKDQGYGGPVNNFTREDGQRWDQNSRQPPFAQGERGEEQPHHGRGRGGRGPPGRNKEPVYLKDLEKNSERNRSYDDFNFGHSVEDPSNDRDQGGTRDWARNRGRGRGGMARAQSMSSVVVDKGADMGKNEEDESRFDQYKLVVSGLSEITTDEGVFNFIEAMSGTEVKEISRLGKRKALVTMADRIEDFKKIKTKGEKRGLDSAKVSIERVPVCASILVSGISDDTTHDAIELYFESQRNSGGPVTKVQFQPKSGRAVVAFQDPRDMERVLARQHERPHVLNKAKLSLRTYHEFLEDNDTNDSDSAATAGGDVSEKSMSQRPEPKAQHLHMAVDPDVMEYVTSSLYHDQLKKALVAKKSEVNWKPNNKMAVIVYRGEDKSDSWQSDCIEEVQNYLSKFTTRDLKVNKDFWEAVKTQLSNIHACFGVDPPLIKSVENAFVLKVVSLSSDAQKFEDQLNAKLEELYREETRKAYVKLTKNVSEERLILLKKIKFVEKLQENNKELEITLDTEAEEIYFEGPQPQFIEATMKFHKLDMGIVEKKLHVSKSILVVLGSDEGLQRVKRELEQNNVEAVFVIDNEAHIVGTSAAHADKAASLVNNLTLEEKVRVDDKSQKLLKTAEWRQLCDELNKGDVIRVYRNNWSDTFVAGFREDVTEAMKKLNAYLENNCIQTERFTCPSKLVRRYLSEIRQDDLRSIETQLANFEVKLQNGRDDEEFVICGNKEGLKRTRRMLDALILETVSTVFEVKQPGLKKYFTSGRGDHLVTSVQKDHACAIHVEKRFDRNQEGMRSRGAEATVDSDAASSDDDDGPRPGERRSDDDEQEEEAVVHSANPTALVTTNGHKISWKAGYIQSENANILVSSQGACSQAIITAGGQAMSQNFINHPSTGDITVTPGSGTLACNHVIHTNCCQWNSGSGETVLRSIVQKCFQKGEELGGTSIAFPVIGAGNLNFPRNEASRIMLDEVVGFCQSNPSSTVKDIRFVVYQQDQALITAFGQEMASLQSQHRLRSSLGGLFRNRSSMLRQSTQPHLAGRLSIEVLQGDLCLETTDAIVNINSTDMNMSNAGELSKAILNKGGLQLQQECSQLGQQTPGSAVMTSGGGLAVPRVIHLIPGSEDKQHLQTCLEAGLDLADKHNLRSVSIPSVGTGGFRLAAADSAQITFQALNNFSRTCKSVCKVRVVVFQPSMMQEFLQAQQGQAVLQDEDELGSDLSPHERAARQPRKQRSGASIANDHSVKISVTGKDQASLEKVVDCLKKGFSEACTTQEVENDTVSQLSSKQIDTLRKKAKDRDVGLEIEADVDRIVVRGDPAEVTGMVGEIWHEINERNQRIQEEQQALLVSKNIEWSYEIQGAKMVFGPKTSAKIEMAHSKEQATVQVSLRADEFVIDLKNNTGRGRRNGEIITVYRKLKGAQEGISLPKHWTPMPQPDMTVHKVQLTPGSTEYQNVMQKLQATLGAMGVQKIERIQNPHLYQSYMVRKQKMDKDNGGNNERQLFHGTNATNITAINTQGFNRSFCGVNGVMFGRGVYFARDASYSIRYARGGSGTRYMYLAKVLVGQYCQGNSAMIVPPPKNISRPEILYESVVDNIANPSIYVVFYDTQCYPEYLITF